MNYCIYNGENDKDSPHSAIDYYENSRATTTTTKLLWPSYPDIVGNRFVYCIWNSFNGNWYRIYL